MDEEGLIDYFLPAKKVGDEWRKNPKWLEIRGITTKELYSFTGQVERGTPLKGSKTQSAPVDGKVMTFGKHKGKSIEWVKTNDKWYYNWACENVKGFK